MILNQRYHSFEAIGGGGSSDVFSAVDERSAQRVAIKCVRDPRMAALLAHEFSTAALLSHPSIVKLHHIGRFQHAFIGFEEGTAFLVSELIDGDILAPRPEFHRNALDIIANILSALALLHAHGFVHGDLKPQNILISKERRPVLLDFGLAQKKDNQALRGGTLGFFAPEIAQTGPSPKSDIYALGVTLKLFLEGGPTEFLPLCDMLLRHDADARPGAAQALHYLAELSKSEKAKHFRDQNLRCTRWFGPQYEDILPPLTACSKNIQIVRISGRSGSGISHTLRSLLAGALAQGFDTSGALVDGSLGEASILSTWGFDALTSPFENATNFAPWCIAVDDLPKHSSLEKYLIRTQNTEVHRGGLILLGIKGADKKDCKYFRSPLTEQECKLWLESSRCLRPEDAALAPLIHATSGGHPQTIQSFLHKYPGDALAISAKSGKLSPTETKAQALSPDELEILHTLAWFDDGLEHNIFGLLCPKASAQAIQELKSRDLLRLNLSKYSISNTHYAETFRLECDRKRRHVIIGILEAAEVYAGVCDELLSIDGEPQAQFRLLQQALSAYHKGKRSWAERWMKTLCELGQQDAVSELSLLWIRSADWSKLEELAKKHNLNPKIKLEMALAQNNDDAFNAALLSASKDLQYEFTIRRHTHRHQYREALQLIESIPAKYTSKNILYLKERTLGLKAFHQGEYTKAEEHFQKALDLASQGSSHHQRELARHGLATVAHKRGKGAKAIKHYEILRQLADDRGDLRASVLRRQNIAAIQVDLGRYAQAERQYTQCRLWANMVGDQSIQFYGALNHANLLGRLGLFHQAQQRLYDANKYKVEASLEAGYFFMIRGEIESAQGNSTQANKNISAAKEIFQKYQHQAGLLEIELLLLLYFSENDESLCRRYQLLLANAEASGLKELYWRSLIAACMPGKSAPQKKAAVHFKEKLKDEVETALNEQRARPDIWAALAYAAYHFPDEAPRLLKLSGSNLETIILSLNPTHRAAYEAHPQHQRALVILQEHTQATTHEGSQAPTFLLERFFSINRELAQERDSEALISRVVDAAMMLSGAEHGCVVLRDGESLHVHTARGPAAQKNDMVIFSRSVAERALNTGRPVASESMGQDTQFFAQQSLHAQTVLSVLCLPLISRGHTLGALYLDHRQRIDAFKGVNRTLLEAFADQVAIALSNARQLQKLEDQKRALQRSQGEVVELNARLEAELKSQAPLIDRFLREDALRTGKTGDYNMIGRSPAMQRVYRLIARVAPKNVTVTILGESGTGKELVARAIHQHSSRANKPFLALNCGAISEQLIESELFGHERGAFTGAVRAKVGFFEAAHQGTLFLDEIGELPLNLQVKLLRVLQLGEIRRIGSTQTKQVDVRVLAATNQALSTMVGDGRFREDLWYRLNVVEISLAALRERREDIPLLVEYFIKQYRDSDFEGLHRDALAAMLQYEFPGNIRELQNEIQRLAILVEGKATVQDLSPRLIPAGQIPQSNPDHHRLEAKAWQKHLDELEARVIENALHRHQGNVSQAAQELELTRPGLYKKMRKHDLVGQFRKKV